MGASGPVRSEVNPLEISDAAATLKRNDFQRVVIVPEPGSLGPWAP